MLSHTDEAQQARWFETQFKCTLAPVKNQRCGCARDYTIVSLLEGSPLTTEDIDEAIEFKYDYKAKTTGNLYLEYIQTFNGGSSWADSGMSLAVEQSKSIVYSVRYVGCVCHFVFTSEQMKRMLARNLRSIRTRHRSNGNNAAHWTNGYLLPIKTIPGIYLKQTEHT